MFKYMIKKTSMMKTGVKQVLFTTVFVIVTFLSNPLFAKNNVAQNSANESINQANAQPNVIFFSVDDLNTWVGPLGDKQVKTPNMDRLAAAGITFTNAHAPGVFCAPSRSAIWTGLQASTTGVYKTEVYHHDFPELVPLQKAFKKGGYNTFGAGKLYHHRSGYVDLRAWDEFYSRSKGMRESGWEMNGYHFTDVPLPQPYPYSPYYNKTNRKFDIPNPYLEGPTYKEQKAKYRFPYHLEWGPIANEQEEEMLDTVRTNWAVDVLARKHDKPFFIGLGMYSPHYPNYAPQKYFDLYDRDSIVVAPHKADDLEDLPVEIRNHYTKRAKDHHELEKLAAVKDATHAYLASISYADAMLGRIMDAVEASPYKDNTMIVFWSDQGFHHGEKAHWGKHTLWDKTTRVPFIWSGKGIPKNKRINTTVSLIDMYPTLRDIANLPMQDRLDGVSLAPILKKPALAKERNVFIPHAERESYAVVNVHWRYIHYKNGGEELYYTKQDPNEWHNLAGDKKYTNIINELQKSAPSTFAESATPKKDLQLVVEGDSFHWLKKK